MLTILNTILLTEVT